MILGKLWKALAAQMNKVANFFWTADSIDQLKYEYDKAVDQMKDGREVLTAVENDSAGAVSRRSKTTAHNRAVLCEGRIGAIAPIPPPFRGSHRSAQRHGDVERDTT